MKILAVGAELFRAEGQTGKCDEANNRHGAKVRRNVPFLERCFLLACEAMYCTFVDRYQRFGRKY
jgi:hypothetical protein